MNKHRFKFLSKECTVSRKATIYGHAGISIGNGVIIHDYAILRCTSWRLLHKTKGEIIIGDNTIIQPYSYLHSDSGKISIGRDCSVNPFSLFSGTGNLIIGNDVRIGAGTYIFTNDHYYDRIDIPVTKQGNSLKGVTIEDGVMIGAGTRIMDGVTIRKGCFIGSGCVVTHSTEPYGVYVGVPARKIKSRI